MQGGSDSDAIIDLHSMSNPAVKKKPRGKPFTGKDDPRRNPGGRPADETRITYWLRRKLEEPGFEGKTQGELLAEAIVLGALKGDARMVSLIWDRTEGKVAEQVNLSGGLSLYEQGSSDAARLADEKGRAALLATVRELSGRVKK